MDPRKHFSALNIIHKIIRERVQPGDLCIDATAGRGNDALFLAELVGETGHVTAFDIQQDAVDSTKKLLEEHGMTSRTDVLLKSHSEMDEICEEGTVSCITFNFGWLPQHIYEQIHQHSGDRKGAEAPEKRRHDDSHNLLRKGDRI